MNTILFLTEYFTEILKLYILTFFIFNCPSQNGRRKFYILLSGSVSTILIYLLIPSGFLRTQLTGLTMILSVILMLKKTREFPIAIISFMILNVIDFLISNIYLFANQITIDELLADQPTCTLLNIAILPFLLFICQFLILIRYRRKSQPEPHSDYHLNNAMLATAFLFLCSFCALAIQEYYNRLTGIAFVSLYLLLLFMICMYNLSRHKKDHFNLSFYRQFSNAQMHYYDLSIQRDTETKKFRHDIKDHLYCLKILLEQNQTSEALNYLKSIEEFTDVKVVLPTTGNRFLDIVAQDVFSECGDIHLDWKGHFPEKTTISNSDLCILFSNLLRNALEAAHQVLDSEKIITVEISIFQGSLIIIITNPCLKAPFQANGRLITSKKDYMRHGFGFLNIQDVVTKYNGTIQIDHKEDTFIAALYFPNIISDSSSHMSL